MSKWAKLAKIFLVALVFSFMIPVSGNCVPFEVTFNFQGGFHIFGHPPAPQQYGFDYYFTPLLLDTSLVGNGVTISNIFVSALGISQGAVINWDWEVFLGSSPFGVPEGQFNDTLIDPVTGYTRTAPTQLQFVNGVLSASGDFIFSGNYDFITGTMTATPSLGILKNASTSEMNLTDGLYAQLFFWTGDNRNCYISFEDVTLTVKGDIAQPIVKVYPYRDEYVIMVGNGIDGSTGKLVYIPINPEDGTLGSASYVADLGYRSGAGIADFDNDGDSDFVGGAIVERSQEGVFADFYLFENIGNGKFVQHLIASRVDAGYNGDNRVGTFAVADFNGDRLKDFVVPIYESDHVYLFTNNGDKTFSSTLLSPLSNPSDAKEGDFNEDGKMDFVITDYFNADVYLYQGDGNGGFEKKFLFKDASGYRAADIAAGDFNKDGHMDIIVDDFRILAGSAHLYFGDGKGNFDSLNPIEVYSRPFLTGYYPYGVDSFDFDKDGNRDLILSTYEYGPTGVVFIMKGNGDGTFQTLIQIASGLGSVFPVTPSLDLKCLKKVTIDIKPRSYPNSINLGSKGVVPVAVLTTNSFEASKVDPSTVKFAGASPLLWTMEDVDFDGDLDMLFHFDTQILAELAELNETSTEATLSGYTTDGWPIDGTDTVNIVPKEKVR